MLHMRNLTYIFGKIYLFLDLDFVFISTLNAVSQKVQVLEQRKLRHNSCEFMLQMLAITKFFNNTYIDNRLKGVYCTRNWQFALIVSTLKSTLLSLKRF